MKTGTFRKTIASTKTKPINTGIRFRSKSPHALKSAQLCLLSGGLVLSAFASAAAPTVSGNVISMSNDGWYQVQSATDYSSICEGVRQCTVPTGKYFVINHSTGERFNTTVTGTTTGGGGNQTEVTVTGNTISWPNDGWYQVQSATTYASLCQGGRSCDVADGTYNVINLTTGKRFSNIKVPQGTTTNPPTTTNGITISGNTISWTGNDWYQVQSETSYESLCEGGQQCTVPAGRYVVINHTTGKRITGVVITGDTTNPGGGGTAPSKPTNLRSSVYSKTQAELFWSAPSSSNGIIIGYDVYENGKLVAQQLDGKSYFAKALQAGTFYEYKVIAIDAARQKGEAAVTSFTTAGTTTQPPVTNTGLVAAAAAPIVDSNNQVSWAFSPTESGLTLDIKQFVEMPLASNGKPARWNDMATLGDRIFISDEQDGRIYEITNGTASLWFDIGDAVQLSTGRSLNIDNPFHGGLRGIAFHPNFANNGKLYTSLVEQRPADPSQHHYLSDANAIDADSVLVEWTVNPSTMVPNTGSYREVFRVGIPEYDHPIKQIAFNPAATSGSSDYGLLYIAHGDGSKESTTAVGGQGNNALGKILRINPLASGQSAYSVPGSNPFVGKASMLDEVYSLGHRNPHHLAFMNNGKLLVAEDGRDNIDEINLVVAGADYGWSQREGAYVQLPQGTLKNGITTLPSNDAANNFTYPIAQFGHYGPVGGTFLTQALGGGFVVENGSALDGHYFYVDFPRTGDMLHSKVTDLMAATTRGNPQSLTVAKTYKASIKFDNDNNSQTASVSSNMRDIIQSTGSYDFSNRVDIRYGQGPKGELYLMNKRNNVVYLVTNSLPAGSGGGGGTTEPGLGKPTSNTGTHGFNNWNSMTTSAAAVTPSDCLLGASGDLSSKPVYCFSPYDRRLMRIESSGEIRWQFPLPGENASNHMESIDYVNGYAVAIIADATPSYDDSAYDMSLFNQSGAYIGTYHIIPDIANPNGTDYAGVNLDGLDLIVRVGPIRRHANFNSGDPTQAWTNDIYIYGEHYSEIAGGDPKKLSGWKREGAFRARIDSRTGATLNTKLFPNKRATEALSSCPVPTSASQSADAC